MSASEIVFTPAGAKLRRGGLLGWVRFTLGGLALDSVAVRRSAEGRLLLSFPARTDGAGIQRAFVRPVDGPTQAAIERTIFAELGRRRLIE